MGSHLGFRLDDGAGRRPGLEKSKLSAPASSDIVSLTPSYWCKSLSSIVISRYKIISRLVCFAVVREGSVGEYSRIVGCDVM